ncbi:hypothetical protein MTO96_027444 [Rhipicephalus appendiculatus]
MNKHSIDDQLRTVSVVAEGVATSEPFVTATRRGAEDRFPDESVARFRLTGPHLIAGVTRDHRGTTIIEEGTS